MKIIALEASNIKNLKVVKIKPDGSIVVVGGDNEQGKSSLLDSIEMAFNGQKSIPIKPIREGQKKAHVIVDLGDIQVTRTFTEKGSKLVVKNKDGATFPSPQAMLDKLIGNLAFDPLEFSRMDDKKRLETLKKVVELDFAGLDAEYKKTFDARTDTNRRGKELKSQFDSIENHDDVPDKELSVAEMSKQLEQAMIANQDLEAIERGINDDQENLAKVLSQTRQLQNDAKSLTDKITVAQKKVDKRTKQDLTELQSNMRNAETTNKNIRDKQAKTKLDQELKQLRQQSGELTTKLETIKGDRENQLSQAKFPIKKLSFDEDGVVFDGIPFDQCSTAQKLKISVAMGLTMNPELRVLLIREGSFLDAKNLEMIAKMADKAKAQIWIERVSKGKECQVIIEDGSVVEQKQEVVANG